MLTAWDSILAKVIVSVFFHPKALVFICLAFFSGIAAAFFVLTRRLKKLRFIAERLNTAELALDSFPDGYFLWIYDSVGFLRKTRCSRRLAVMLNLTRGFDAPFDALLEHFTPDGADLLTASLNEMRANDTPFAVELPDASRTRGFRITGFRNKTADKKTIDVLWVREITETTKQLTELRDKTKSLESRNALLEQIFDALPVPLWARNDGYQIVLCNSAYAVIARAENPEKAVLLGSELVYEKSANEAKIIASTARAMGKRYVSDEYVVIDGKRRLVTVNETLLPARAGIKNGTVGFLKDVTPEHELRNALRRQAEAHEEVLEHLKTAIAVFDADMRLQFYNMAFLKLWNLDEKVLDSSPSYPHLLDILRENRKLPENRDFAAYKSREIKFFTTLISATEDVMHLPSGVTLRRTLTPHPLGGLLITYEDVTGHLTMERSMTVLNETQHTVLNHLREAILLFGGDGRLRLANEAYLTLWEIGDAGFNSRPMTIGEVLDGQKPFFENEENWEALKEQLLGVVNAHTGEAFQILRPDGKVLEFLAAGLPDGGIFVSFLDVTEVEKNSSIALEKEALLSRFKQTTVQAEKLRAVFLEQLGREISPQLTALDDAANLLGDSRHRMNQKQKACLQKVADATAELKTLFGDMADLALIETGSAVLELDSVDIPELLDGVLLGVREQAKNKNVALNVSLPEKPPLLIADKKRLKQVLFYLVGNAVGATFKDGAVDLSVTEDDKSLIITLTERSLDVKNDFDTVNFAAQNGFASALIRGFIEMHGGTLGVSDKNGTKKTQIRLPVHREI